MIRRQVEFPVALQEIPCSVVRNSQCKRLMGRRYLRMTRVCGPGNRLNSLFFPLLPGNLQFGDRFAPDYLLHWRITADICLFTGRLRPLAAHDDAPSRKNKKDNTNNYKTG